MPTFSSHVTFLNEVWGLNAQTLPAMRATANASGTTLAPQFALGRIQEYQQQGRDPTSIVEELIEMGPSINVLLQLTAYLNFIGRSSITVPRKKKRSSLPQHVEETSAAAPTLIGNNDKSLGPELPTLSSSAPNIDHDESSTHEDDDHIGSPLSPPVVDQRTLEIATFVLWWHDFTPEHLLLAEFVEPSKLFVPLAVHNEIIVLFAALREILEVGCDGIELLAYDEGTVTAPSEQPPNNNVEAEELSRKAILQAICLRLDLGDPQFWRSDSGLFYMLIHSLRMCYAMATDVDEKYIFAGGRTVLSLDNILINVLDCSLHLPECLFGLANQMLIHHTHWVTLRGRLANAYDILAMVPAAVAHSDSNDCPRTVADLIDTRPRGRLHRSCFNLSTPRSNQMLSSHWKRVVLGSLFVFVSGVLVARKANQQFVQQ